MDPAGEDMCCEVRGLQIQRLGGHTVLQLFAVELDPDKTHFRISFQALTVTSKSGWQPVALMEV